MTWKSEITDKQIWILVLWGIGMIMLSAPNTPHLAVIAILKAAITEIVALIAIVLIERK